MAILPSQNAGISRSPTAGGVLVDVQGALMPSRNVRYGSKAENAHNEPTMSAFHPIAAE